MTDFLSGARADELFADGTLVLFGLVLVAGLGVLAYQASRGRVASRPWTVGLVGGTTAAAFASAQAVVVDEVVDAHAPTLLDLTAWAWFIEHRGELLTMVMEKVSELGGTATMSVLAVMSTCWLAWRRRRDEAVLVASAGVGAVVLVQGLKHVYGRVRPPVSGRLVVETSNSLPSGHSVASFVVLGVLAVLLARRVANFAARAAIRWAAAGAIGLIGVSRLYLGVHWATDVLTGWLIGAAWLTTCFTALTAVRAGREQPTTSGGSATTPAASLSSTP